VKESLKELIAAIPLKEAAPCPCKDYTPPAWTSIGLDDKCSICLWPKTDHACAAKICEHRRLIVGEDAGPRCADCGKRIAVYDRKETME